MSKSTFNFESGLTNIGRTGVAESPLPDLDRLRVAELIQSHQEY